jgi:DNA polymerase III alpha subunit (gram-positive type)
MKLYLPMDNETGGVVDGVSLLSTYLEVVDEKFNVIDSLELFVKPNNGIYKVTGESLDVNKINLVEHEKTAITYSEAGQKLFHFLKKNSDDGKIKLIPVGKNVQFDVRGLQEHLLGKGTMNKFVSYRLLDITAIAMALQIKGKIPEDQSLSLSALIEYFGITNIEGNIHEAKYDTKATMLVFKELLDLV